MHGLAAVISSCCNTLQSCYICNPTAQQQKLHPLTNPMPGGHFLSECLGSPFFMPSAILSRVEQLLNVTSP